MEEALSDSCSSIGNSLPPCAPKKLKQQDMIAIFDKTKKKEVDAAFCRAFYHSHIPFRLIECPYLQEAVRKAITYGPAYKMPTRRALAGPFLKEEKERLGEDVLKNAREIWKRYGVTVIGDGWTDGRARCVQGIAVYSAGKVYFLKAYDTSLGKKAEDLFGVWSEAIEFVGPDNVIQFIGDGEPTNRRAGRMLEEEYPSICFSPCIAHCINNMMKDIGNLDWVAPNMEKGRKIVTFVNSHTKTLTIFRRKSKKKDLVKYCETRFAYNFLMLERLVECKDHIRQLFTDPIFLQFPEAQFDNGKEAIAIAFDELFWNDVQHLTVVSARMTKLLRLVDGLRPCIGKVYEGLDRMTEYLQKVETDNSRMTDLKELCTSRWAQYHSDLHCAAFVLDPEFHGSEQEKDKEVSEGWSKTLIRLEPQIERRRKIREGLRMYRLLEGSFGAHDALEDMKNIDAVDWWENYGSSAPLLQTLATRILSQNAASSPIEQIFSKFGHIHSKKRKRLGQQKLNDLVFVSANLQLMNKILNPTSERYPTSIGWMDDEEDNGEEEDNLPLEQENHDSMHAAELANDVHFDVDDDGSDSNEVLERNNERDVHHDEDETEDDYDDSAEEEDEEMEVLRRIRSRKRSVAVASLLG